MRKNQSENVYYKQQVARMQVIKLIRAWLDERGFQELICPVLQPGVPAEPTIYPFVTRWDRYLGQERVSSELFLPLSPERAMKHYLSLGAGDCYSIGHCARNLEGVGPTHHPEFLMLEWYRVDCDYQQIMDDTRELLCFLTRRLTGKTAIEYQGQKYDWSRWRTLSVEALWQEKFGVSIKEILDLSAITQLARDRGYQTEGSDWEQIFNQLFLNEIEPTLPSEPFFLLDFPACLSPLCRPRRDRPWLAERFEVYVGGMELGNGNSEQLDAAAIRALFDAEIVARQRRGEFAPPLDEGMLADIARMQKSGHTYAGIGLGVDRVVMLLTGVEEIGAWWPQL